MRSEGAGHSERLPALRALQIAPLAGPGQELYFALYDQTQIAAYPLAVSWPGYFVLAHLDGRHTVRQIAAAFSRRFGTPLPLEQIERLIAKLDEALLLQNERFERAYAARREAYLAAPARVSRCGPADGALLRAEIERLLAAGAGAPPVALRGVIAPHLDYRRGAACYAAAGAALARAPLAGRYVILGTNHAGRARAVVATGKDFQTPLGLVATDRAFIGRLEERLGRSLCEHEFDHQAEHSVELQVQILQVLAQGRRFAIVPLLCPDPCGGAGGGAPDGGQAELRRFADALAGLLGQADEPTILIAGADLSHVGQRFGDAQQTTPQLLQALARKDRQLLALLEQRREEEFVATVRAAGNPTRICSVGCIYALLRALPGLRCRVLAYRQAADLERETTVTCMAAVVGRAPGISPGRAGGAAGARCRKSRG